MGIGPREPKFPTFCAMHSLQVLADSMYKTDRRGAHECLRVIGLERTESRRVALSLGFVWSPRLDVKDGLDRTGK